MCIAGVRSVSAPQMDALAERTWRGRHWHFVGIHFGTGWQFSCVFKCVLGTSEQFQQLD